MASSKESSQTHTVSSTRPLGQYRVSITSGSLPVRSANARHSHSVSLGSLNSTHRVTRRKSVSSNATNLAAVAAAAKEAGDTSLGQAVPTSSRRNTISKVKGAPTPPSSLPTHRMSILAASRRIDRDESAIDDDQIGDDGEDEESTFNKARIRRASDGQQLSGKKLGANELRCEKCGKNYKHSSCLTKHRWEHTPEWSYTSKLLISKHQQVQLLEAASVLVGMNTTTTPPDSARDFHSDRESDSPPGSTSSDHHDGSSSADTTPPPATDVRSIYTNSSSSYANRTNRYSSGSGFSRSYQSAPSSNPIIAGSVPSDSGHGSYVAHRMSAGESNGEDEADLAAAVGLLSCSFGTPRTGPVTLPSDVPPVPPLPARYASYQAQSILTPTNKVSAASTSYVRDGRDIKMEESEEDVMDDDDYEHDLNGRARSDEDDDGVFGRMEE